MLGLNHRGEYQFNVKVICVIFAGVGIALRGISKLLRRQGLHNDDYWILASLLSYWGAVGFCIWGLITGGGGMEIGELMVVASESPKGLSMAENYLQSLFFGYILCTISLYATKISILLFYRRVFSVETVYQRAIQAIMLVATAWFFSAELTTLLACRPVSAFWDRSIPGSKCFNFSAMYLGTGIVDVLLDLVILILPIRKAFQLQMPLRTRLAVATIFALGGFVVIAQIFRLTMVYNPDGNTMHFAELEKWTNIHETTAIICACLPHCKPLLVSVSERFEKSIFHLSSVFRSTSTNSETHLQKHPPDDAILAKSAEYESSSVMITTGSGDSFDVTQKPNGVIVYSRSVDVV